MRRLVESDQNPLHVIEISVVELLIHVEAIFRLGDFGPGREERGHDQSLAVNLVLAEPGPSLGGLESR